MGERASVGRAPVQRGGGLGYEGVEKGLVVCSGEGYAPPANWRVQRLPGLQQMAKVLGRPPRRLGRGSV